MGERHLAADLVVAGSRPTAFANGMRETRLHLAVERVDDGGHVR